MHENERKAANKRILDKSKIEVEHRMLQMQVTRYQDENMKLQDAVSFFQP